VDYILSVDRSIDAGMIPYPKFGSAAFSEVGLMLYIPYVKTFDSDHRSVTLPVVVNDSVTDTISQSGTATVQYDLSDGGTYWIRAYESSFVTITASEPSSFLSLGLGLSIIAAVGLRSKR
jgi:hypothetical protein